MQFKSEDVQACARQCQKIYAGGCSPRGIGTQEANPAKLQGGMVDLFEKFMHPIVENNRVFRVP